MDSISQRVLKILEWPQVLEKLAGYCMSGPGKGFVAALTPLPKKEVGPRLAKISAIKELISRDEVPNLTGLNDISPFLEYASKEGILGLEELSLVRDFCLCSAAAALYFKNHREEFPALDELYQSLQETSKLKELLHSSITSSNELNESFYPVLARMREKIFETKNEIETRLKRIISNPDMSKALQETVFSMRQERYVLLVRAGMKGKIRGTVHDVSASGSTLYIEPDSVADLNNQAVILQRELEIERKKILKKLTQEVSDHEIELSSNLQVLAEVDFLRGAARFSIAVKGNEQQLSDRPMMALRDARHPLLQLMDPENNVPNYIEIGEDYRGLIISGANTGGKTVLLKTLGLCALFNLYGLHLPAGPDSKIGHLTHILADIGDDQNLSQSLSTFSGQVLIINEMIEKAGPGTLVIIDEIIVGTNPRQGAALSQAILEKLIKTGCLLVVTTHYSELKEMSAQNSEFRNASVSFDMETLKPTYKLKIGLAGVSYAMEIASNYGMDKSVIGRSRELVDSRELSFESLMEEMQARQKEMDQERDRLSELQQNLTRKESQLTEKEKDLNIKGSLLKQKEGLDFLEELRARREEIAEKIHSLQQGDLKEAGKLQQEILEQEESLVKELQSEQKKRFINSHKIPEAADLKEGSRVILISLEKEGIIESMDRDSDRATVLLGNAIRTQVKIKDLMLPSHAQKPAVKDSAQKRKTREPRVTTPPKSIPTTIQTSYNTVDLRGMRVDEALRILSSDLDAMSRQGINTAVVIHGHGTGALKEAVRRELTMSIYASDFRPGEMGEGGDGVTIVMLRG